MYISASSLGLGRQDDAGIVRVYLPASSSSLVADYASLEPEEDASHGLTAVLQLLEGVHLASSLEALDLAQKCGLEANYVHEVISNAAGTSRVFERFGPAIVEDGCVSPEHLSQVISSLVSRGLVIHLFLFFSFLFFSFDTLL